MSFISDVENFCKNNYSLCTMAALAIVFSIGKLFGRLVFWCQEQVGTAKKTEDFAKTNFETLVKPQQSLQMMTPNDLLIPFYQNQGKDAEGRTLEEIWNMSDDLKESRHNYIQWLFPSRGKSQFNANSPVLNDKLADQMRKDSKILANIAHSFEVMMRFYGFVYDSKTRNVDLAPSFEERSKVWLTTGNHNFRRISRILACLVEMHLIDQAGAFLKRLTVIKNDYPQIVGDAFQHWKLAASI